MVNALVVSSASSRGWSCGFNSVDYHGRSADANADGSDHCSSTPPTSSTTPAPQDSPPPPPPPPPPAPKIEHVARVSEIVNGELRTPSKIPKKVSMIQEDEAPPPSNGVMGGVVGGVPGGSSGGVIGGLVASTAPPPRVA